MVFKLPSLKTLNHYDAVLLLGYAGIVALTITGLSHYPVALFCGLVFLASIRLFQTPAHNTKTGAPIRAFLGAYSIALLLGFFRAKELSSGFLLLIALGAFPIGYWLGRHVRVQASLDRLSYLYPAGLMVLALWGLWDWWQTGVSQGSLNYRPKGPLTDHNTYAALLCTGSLLSLGVWPKLGPLKRHATLGSILLAGVVFVLAQSRGAFVAFSVTLLLASFIWATFEPLKRRVLFLGGALGASILLASVLLYVAPGMNHRMLEVYKGGPHNALESRWMQVESSREMYLDGNRWVGNGLGHWQAEYARYRHEYLSLGNNPHNDYLLLLVDTGPIGALSLMGIGFLLITTTRSQWRKALKYKKDRANSLEFLATGLALVLLFGYAGLNFVFSITATGFLVGLLLARFEYLICKLNQDPAREDGVPLKFVLPGILLASVWLSIPLILGEISGKALISQQFKEAQLVNEAMAEQLAKNTAELLPGYALPLAGLGYLNQRKSLRYSFEFDPDSPERTAAAAEAYGWFLRAHRAKPSRGLWGFQAGKIILDTPGLYELPGYPKLAEILIRDALYYRPTDEVMLSNYAEWLSLQHRREDALRILDEGIKKQGDFYVKDRLHQLRQKIAELPTSNIGTSDQ
jgi:hypothetical protein